MNDMKSIQRGTVVSIERHAYKIYVANDLSIFVTCDI